MTAAFGVDSSRANLGIPKGKPKVAHHGATSFLAPASKSAQLEAVMIDVATKFGVAVSCKRSSTVPTG